MYLLNALALELCLIKRLILMQNINTLLKVTITLEKKFLDSYQIDSSLSYLLI